MVLIKMHRFTKPGAAKRIASITLLAWLAACGGGNDGGDAGAGNGNADPVAPDTDAPPAPAPAALAAPDINRPVLASDPVSDETYPVAAFHRRIVEQGAHFTLNGQFRGEQTTNQRHQISRSALTSSPSAWLNRDDLSRTVVTVDRFENGVASTSDVYADYFDATNQAIGSRTQGASIYGVAENELTKPATARLGERGTVGRVKLIETDETGGASTVGYRDTTWEMLRLSDGTPAYCEKTQELSGSDRVVFVSELCHGLDTNGQSNQTATYSFSSAGASGGLIATDFVLGPATDPSGLVDGAPFNSAEMAVNSSERRVECLRTVDGPPRPGWPLARPVPTGLKVDAFSYPLKLAQGELFVDFSFAADNRVTDFRWDSFELGYVGSKRYVDGDQSMLVSGKFDQQLRINYFRQSEINTTNSTTDTTECYDGVVNRLALPQDGPASILQCTGLVFPFRDVTIAHTLVVSDGRISVRPSNEDVRDYEIDLLLVEEFDQYNSEGALDRRTLEVLPDGWRRWSELKQRARQSQQDIVIEFDDQWNIRRYDKSGSDTDISGAVNNFECVPG